MKTVSISLKLPENLHKQFKIKMVLEGRSMQEYIIQLIAKDVKESNIKIG